VIRPRTRTFLLILALAGLGLTMPGCGAPGYDWPDSNHVRGQRFHNLPAVSEPGLFEFLQWSISSRGIPWSTRERLVAQTVPLARSLELRITHINHATVLIQIDGVNVLTDPIWSERASPVSFVGPKRLRSPGVAFESLPSIDVVLISHNHHDHCSAETLQRLAERHNPVFIGGLGTQALLSGFGIQRTVDLDWWQEKWFEGVRVGFAPAKHWSARSIDDRNHTLWGSFFVRGSSNRGRLHSVYFAGDTGYGAHFQEIAKRYGTPTVALLPIGAYKPEWFMHAHHMSPTDAVRAHQDLKSTQSYGIHWGTFDLSDEGEYEPAGTLGLALDAAGIARSEFEALENADCRVQANRSMEVKAEVAGALRFGACKAEDNPPLPE
jgi:L-ascorbate metabolism protein UlaG (beta-lactamase superfamily)